MAANRRWLADEVGMGKTMVCTCLILAARAKNVKPITDKAFKGLLKEETKQEQPF